MNQDVITSANDWLVKAGAHLVGDQVIMPHKFLLVPMTLASEAIVEFRKHEDIGSRIKHGLVVVSMVRMADTAFYKTVSNILNNQNKSTPNICQHCIRGQLCGTNMKNYRQIANKQIIHKMESGNGEVVTKKDLDVVELYYEEMFKLPLIDPISFPERKGLSLCQNCKKKWAKYNQANAADAKSRAAD